MFLLSVLYAGLPCSAVGILEGAIRDAFGDTVELVELGSSILRSRIRLSSRNVEVVLVVLEGVIADSCSDIAGDLYSSDKYYRYVSDFELARFLNGRYGLSIEVAEEEETVSEVTGVLEPEGDSVDIVEIKDEIIRSLEAKIKEITEFYEHENQGVSSEEVENLRLENSELVAKIETLNSALESKSIKLGDLESIAEGLKSGKNDLENRLERVSKNYDELVLELNKLKVDYSNLSSMMRDKDVRIVELEKKEAYLSVVLEEGNSLKKLLDDRDIEISKLIDENTRLNSANEDMNSSIEGLRSEVSRLGEEVTSLSGVGGRFEELNAKYLGVVKENSELAERIKRDDENLFELNKEKMALISELDTVKKSLGVDSNTDFLIKEVQELQSRLASSGSGVFGGIPLSARGSIGSRVISSYRGSSSVSFAFAGSSCSRKGAYKCLYEELSNSSDGSNYLIVDLVSESCIDYVFRIKRVVSAVDWFSGGGSLSSYLSNTCIEGVKVLSAGLGYINDSFFLGVDWDSRLGELSRSGYRVIVFCGDISNVVGRVLYESFVGVGSSVIYVFGSVTGSRALVSNLRGLEGSCRSRVVYFGYNPASKRFYDLVARSNVCSLVSLGSKR